VGSAGYAIANIVLKVGLALPEATLKIDKIDKEVGVEADVFGRLISEAGTSLINHLLVSCTVAIRAENMLLHNQLVM
jgi:hypothetical protein